MNTIMKMVDERTCTGCSSCIAVCPYGNLSMKQCDLGFLVPDVKNRELCIDCGKCIKACPFLNELEGEE